MVATIFFSLAFLSSSGLHGQLEQFGSYHLLQTCFSFFVRLLSRLVAVSSLSFLSNSFSSPLYNLLRMAKHCFLWSSASFSHLILSLSFLCSSVSEALFALSFSFLSERFSSVHAKAALAYSRNEKHGCHWSDFTAQY